MKLIKNRIALIATTFLICFSAVVKADAIDTFIEAEMQKNKIPGLSYAIVKNGEIVQAKGYGLASIELKAPATPETVYQSGSIGKQFTATLIMMLVEEGKIDLDKKIGAYIKNTPKKWENITVRHLLTHTSGIKEYTDGKDEKNNPANINYRLDYTDDQLVQMAAAMSLDFQPGEKWSYSNTGYVLLGIIVNNASGQFWGDMAEARIFKPLGMNSTRAISETDIIPNRAAGYRLTNREIKNQTYVSPSLNRTGDGSLYLTVLDLAKWDAALYTEKLLKKENLTLMCTPAKLNNGENCKYGFGWRLTTLNDHKAVSHGGAWQGFTGQIFRFPDDKLTVIVLTNLGPKILPLAEKIAGIYNSSLAEKPK